MLKIQHGFAGFFAGAFTGFLMGLIEMRIISKKHPFLFFCIISFTVILCGIIGMSIGLKMARKKNKHR